MPIEVNCQQCGRLLRAPDAAAGRSAKCPQCSSLVQIPSADVYDAEEIDSLDEPDNWEDDGAGDSYGAPSNYGQGGGYSGGGGYAPQPEADAPRQPCPVCGEMILAHARRCRFCGEQFGGGRGGYSPRYDGRGGRPKRAQGLAIASMVLGIISLVLMCLWFISAPLAILAIILAAVDMSQAKSEGVRADGMSTAGLTCGCITLGLLAVFLVILGLS